MLTHQHRGEEAVLVSPRTTPRHPSDCDGIRAPITPQLGQPRHSGGERESRLGGPPARQEEEDRVPNSRQELPEVMECTIPSTQEQFPS
jgi:hypothetical protein